SPFFFMIPCPPISTLFPYTTLFRSLVCAHDGALEARALHVLTKYVPNGEHLPVEPSLVIEVEIGLVLEHQRSVALREEHLPDAEDRKSTRLNSSHLGISYAVFCLKK